jgi:hypothetical protein
MKRLCLFTRMFIVLSLVAMPLSVWAIGFKDVSLEKDESGDTANFRLYFGTTQNTGAEARYKFVFTVKYGDEMMTDERYDTIPANGSLVAKDTCYRFHVNRPSGSAKSGTVTAVAYREKKSDEWVQEASTSRSFAVSPK